MKQIHYAKAKYHLAAMIGGSLAGRYCVNGPMRSGVAGVVGKIPNQTQDILAGLLARGGVGVSGGLLNE